MNLRADFDRILEHLIKYQVENPSPRVGGIIEVFNVPEHKPKFGRP